MLGSAHADRHEPHRRLMSGTLFVVAVPIGNPDDLSPRARATLASVAVVAAEDTRHFATLARHHGIHTRTVSYHDHNEETRARELIGRLEAGDDVALVSDAGTPLVSDPGYRLVRLAIDAGIPITSVPGPSAVTTALAASGLPPHPYRFLGFLPRTPAARRATFEGVATDPATLVAFEAPRRLADALRDALEVLGDRTACLGRNLTKPHERYQRGTLSALISELESEGEVRGECTLLIGGASGPSVATADAEADARLLLDGGAPARATQDLLVQRHGLSKRDAYALVLRLRDR
jgi:16S rRNA (cytidine1402-2'-O)-methyltransferase